MEKPPQPPPLNYLSGQARAGSPANILVSFCLRLLKVNTYTSVWAWELTVIQWSWYKSCLSEMLQRAAVFPTNWFKSSNVECAPDMVKACVAMARLCAFKQFVKRWLYKELNHWTAMQLRQIHTFVSVARSQGLLNTLSQQGYTSSSLPTPMLVFFHATTQAPSRKTCFVGEQNPLEQSALKASSPQRSFGASAWELVWCRTVRLPRSFKLENSPRADVILGQPLFSQIPPAFCVMLGKNIGLPDRVVVTTSNGAMANARTFTHCRASRTERCWALFQIYVQRIAPLEHPRTAL